MSQLPIAEDHQHRLALFETTEFLVETACRFLGRDLGRGDAVVVVATSGVLGAIEAALRDAAVDVSAARGSDRYVTCDAAAMLGRVIVGGVPDAAVFGEVVGQAVERAAAAERPVRVFVAWAALLADAGDLAAAVTFDDLFTDLATVQAFELLCAYPLRAFDEGAGTAVFDRINARHAAIYADERRLSAVVAASRTQPRDPSDRAAMVDFAERLGRFGTWDWSPQTWVFGWSDNLFRLHGVEPNAFVPSPENVLQLVHPDDRDRVTAAVALLLNAGGVEVLEYRVVHPDTVVRNFRASVGLYEDHGEQIRLIGVVQDVTSEHHAARKLDAHVAVAAALDQWQDFERGGVALVAGLCEALDLCFGVLWLRQEGALTHRLSWHLESEALSALADSTRDGRSGRGSPWVRSALRGHRPVVAEDPARSAMAHCRAAICDAGINAAIAVPAVAVDETLGVLELFSVERIEPAPRLLDSLNGIGHEIGYFLDQRRGELVAPILTPRQVQVLQLSARALNVTEIAEQMHVSPATVKRHFEDAYATLGVGDRAAAVAQAMRLGLID